MKADHELISLIETRDVLMERASNLRDELSRQRKWATVEKRIVNTHRSSAFATSVLKKSSIPHILRCPAQLNCLTMNVLGINYDNVKKKWVQRDLWIHSARVVMKTLTFELKLLVSHKNDVTEIKDITCHFVGQDASLLNEISTWVQSLTKAKNFPSLMFYFSEYNELCMVRKKILNKLVEKRFATIDKCSDGGGIIVHLHSPEDLKTHYAEYLWQIRSNPKTKLLDHHFVIESAGNDFVAANRDLMERFCKSGLRRNILENLWSSVCSAIERYE